MSFIKYQHLERFGNTEVEGIEVGTVYVFPKIDFKVLSHYTTARIKELRKELF